MVDMRYYCHILQVELEFSSSWAVCVRDGDPTTHTCVCEGNCECVGHVSLGSLGMLVHLKADHEDFNW